MPLPTRDWFDYASAITTPLIGVFVAYVALQQWKVAKEKLRLDLYNKRFAALETTLHMFQETLGGTDLSEVEFEELHRRFITTMIEAKFLFSRKSGIAGMLEDFNKSIFIVKGIRGILKQSGIPPEELIKTSARMLDEQQQLPAKLGNIERALRPYLSFE